MSHPLPLIIAHRGASAWFPENTLEAFRAAAEKFKADMIELDVQTTRDGVPVVIHDARLDRTTNGSGLLSQKSFSELRSLDAGFLFDPKKNGQFPWRGKGIKIPSLQEVLGQFPRLPFGIEIKISSAELTHCVAKLLREHGNYRDSIVGSEYHTVSRTLKKYYPACRRFCSRRDILRLLFEFRFHFSHAEKDAGLVASTPLRSRAGRFDTQAWIDFLHARRIKAFFWTVNDPSVIQSLAGKKADGIITDDPGPAHRVLGRLDETAPKGA